MKKELNIPSYKESKSLGTNNYSYIATVLIVVAVVFGGISLKGLTAYSILGGVTPASSSNYAEDPNLNRGTNAVTTIEIIPEKVIAGGPVYITVDAGSKGAWKRSKVWRWGNNPDDIKACGDGVLKDDNVKEYANERPDATQSGVGFKIFDVRTFRYVTDSGWSEGLYAFGIFDYNLNDWTCKSFIVYRLNERSEDQASFDPTQSILSRI